jgi:hypothetical protein
MRSTSPCRRFRPGPEASEPEPIRETPGGPLPGIPLHTIIPLNTEREGHWGHWSTTCTQHSEPIFLLHRDEYPTPVAFAARSLPESELALAAEDRTSVAQLARAR